MELQVTPIKVKVTRSHDPDDDVKRLAMAALALLRSDKKIAIQQIKHLVKLNPDLARRVLTTQVDGWTPVHACAMRGTKKLLKTMLRSGIDLNSTMGQPEGLPAGCTLLHVAVQRSDKKVLQYLLHHGANVVVRDSEGRTPLAYARAGNNKEAVKLLLDCGAGLVETRTASLLYPGHQPPYLEHGNFREGGGNFRNHQQQHRRRASTDLSMTSRSHVMEALVQRLNPRPAHWAASSPCLTKNSTTMCTTARPTTPCDSDDLVSSSGLTKTSTTTCASDEFISSSGEQNDVTTSRGEIGHSMVVTSPLS